MTNNRRTGFNLVELLVVVAIVSLLLLLLLPAVNAVREMGRRTQCIQRQRNLAAAVIGYESAHGRFPTAVAACDARAFNSLGRQAGVSCMGPNWAVQILGQIEEDSLYDQVFDCARDQWHVTDDCSQPPVELGRTVPNWMLCPSARPARHSHRSVRTGFDGLAKGNYAASLGNDQYRAAIEGDIDNRVSRDEHDRYRIGVMSVVLIEGYQRLVELTRNGVVSGEWKFGHESGTSSAKIKDGTSHTVILSEVLPWDAMDLSDGVSLDIRGVWTSASMGGSTYSHKYGPNSRMSDRLNACDRQIPFEHPLRCEQIDAQGPDAAETWASARSAHPDGVVAALADGSVQFYASDIHLPIWQSLATRAGNDR